MKTKELLAEWLALDQRENVKPRTFSRYEGIIEGHIAPSTLGAREIVAVTKREVQDFVTAQRKKVNARTGKMLSATSINLMLTVLRLAFDYACDMDYIAENPCANVRRLRAETKQAEAFTVAEQRALEKEIERLGNRYLHGILLCLYTGLRLGELLGLTWEDVDMEKGVIQITKAIYREKVGEEGWQTVVGTPKTRSSERVIPLPAYVTRMLEEDRRLATSPYVVENKKGERMAIRSYQYMFEKLTERAGVRRLKFHALRHTFATRAIECGMDIRTVADLMGHKNASITLNCYAHCMLDHKMQMMQKLPRAFCEKNCAE